ncbi:hypothetical protein [Cellulomonas endophytica]|uniref:hypothetical protein n=1 Tax=Cellulomonas endophytica TaxID=2494735 RepID=UPI001010F97E|nr:hypothetical protein [Cellulomonas endophytica]
MPRRLTSLWAAAAALAVLVGALLPLLGDGRFYFADDTQAGAYGIWYELGERLRAGTLPLLEVSTWQAGNVLAEGQWGVLNPVVLLLGLAATVVGDAVLLTTAVKVLFLVVASLTTFALARSYEVRHELALLAAVLVPFGGFTLYMDAASWVTGLFTWALLPGFWAALRRAAAGGNPLLAGVLGYLVVTVGYVHGTIALVVVGAGVALEAWLGGHGRPARARAVPVVRVVGLGVLLGLVALAVYLPGILAADVTVRDSEEVTNDNFLVADLSGLLAGVVPLTQPQVGGWWGGTASVPLLYSAWALPLVALVDVRRLAATWRRWSAIAVLLVVATAFLVGPSNLGPLRFPVRMHPYLVLTVVLLLVVGLSRAAAPRPSVRRLGLALAVVALGTYLGYAQVPEHRTIAVVGGLLAAAGLTAAWWALGGVLPARVARLARRPGALRPAVRPRALAGVAVATVLLVGFAQQHWFPRTWLPDFGLPAAVEEYRAPLADVGPGDVIVVGAPTTEAGERGAPPRGTWDDTLVANAWYLNDASVQNVYTPLSYRAYAWRLCMNWRGETCPEALGALFTPVQVGNGERLLVDLLAVSHVQLVRAAFDGDPVVPEGWHLSEETPTTLLWSRDTPVPGAGGVVSTSRGLEVTTVEQSDTRVRMSVASPAGGRVVLSRLDWPGYRVSGGTLAAPAEDFLVTVDVPAGRAGRVVDVSFEAAGWGVGRPAAVVGVAGLLAWSLAAGVLRRRRGRPAGVAPADPAPGRPVRPAAGEATPLPAGATSSGTAGRSTDGV